MTGWLASGLAALALLAAPACAQARWTTQRLGDGPTDGAGRPALAGNARGDVAVAWEQASRWWVSRRPALAARFGRPIGLPRDVAAPKLALLADGTLLIGYLRTDGTSVTPPSGADDEPVRCCDALFVRTLRRGVRRVGHARIASVRGDALGVPGWTFAGGPGGRAVFAGSDADGAVAVVSRGAGHFDDPGGLLSDGFAQGPWAGFGGDGRGAVLWVEGTNHGQMLRGAPIFASGIVGDPRTYLDTPDPTSDFSFFTVQPGIDRRDRLTVLWSDSGPGIGAGSIHVATGPVAGPLRNARQLDRAAGLGAGVGDPQLAVAPDGGAIASWRKYGPVASVRETRPETVRVALRRSGTGAFADAMTVPDAEASAVAMSGDGRAAVVTESGGAHLSVRVVTPRGRAGRPRALGSGRVLSLAMLGTRRGLVVASAQARGLRVDTYVAER